MKQRHRNGSEQDCCNQETCGIPVRRESPKSGTKPSGRRNVGHCQCNPSPAESGHGEMHPVFCGRQTAKSLAALFFSENIQGLDSKCQKICKYRNPKNQAASFSQKQRTCAKREEACVPGVKLVLAPAPGIQVQAKFVEMKIERIDRCDQGEEDKKKSRSFKHRPPEPIPRSLDHKADASRQIYL